MQDKIKELEQEIAKMQKTIQELKEQVPPTASVIQEDSEGIFIGCYTGSGRPENRLIIKEQNIDGCLVFYLNNNMLEVGELGFVNAEYNPKKLTSTQLEALDRVVGRFLNGTIA